MDHDTVAIVLIAVQNHTSLKNHEERFRSRVLLERRLAGGQLHHAVVARRQAKIVLIERCKHSAVAKKTFVDRFERH